MGREQPLRLLEPPPYDSELTAHHHQCLRHAAGDIFVDVREARAARLGTSISLAQLRDREGEDGVRAGHRVAP